ncbi:semialdehyde dehydrogenase [Solitalea longa]|uniref:Semialdehyde dehydrogenase n=1 Tax=Solitalea longa TaxID=2079460 RepID=A0A2S5A5L5_9SPHI|nr:NAD(P)H-binding protein [Solitalea longa]POY37878.1 semialdehyde dehydrogenase [Solitalea longa]
MKALILGATGATGNDLLNKLLTDDAFDQVDIFVRRSSSIHHAKLRVHVIDFDQPEQWKDLVKGDVLFSCLGTTLKTAGSKEAQWKIDYDYQYNFAKVARENNVTSYVLVSAAYASPDSRIFYSRMKGQLEEAIKELSFPQLIIFNPPLLERKNSDRPAEVIGLKVIKFLNKMGLFLAQKPLSTEILAQAMINVSKSKEKGVFSFKEKEIWQCANANW